MSQGVVAECGEEQALARQPRELHRRDGTAPSGFLPGLERVHDLTRRRDALDPCELDPLHVPDDGDPHSLP